MNKQRLKVIAKWLEGGAKHADVKLDMVVGLVPYDPENEAHNACGTSCCLAGAAVQFFDPAFVEEHAVVGKEIPWNSVKGRAIDLLGMDYHEAMDLFEPSALGPYSDLRDYNKPAWAARVVRKLIKTGEVDWVGTETVA